jgi:hypothetical protein
VGAIPPSLRKSPRWGTGERKMDIIEIVTERTNEAREAYRIVSEQIKRFRYNKEVRKELMLEKKIRLHVYLELESLLAELEDVC